MPIIKPTAGSIGWDVPLNQVIDAVNELDGAVADVEGHEARLDAVELITSELAEVATTGTYQDLLGLPFIPDGPSDIGAQPAGDYYVLPGSPPVITGSRGGNAALANLLDALALAGIITDDTGD